MPDESNEPTSQPVRKHDGTFHWEGVDVLKYKQEGSAPFKDVTRQVLFDGGGMPVQLRYFEVAAGGWTTLERHEHIHNVMVIRGRGRCLIGDRMHDLVVNDLVSVPPMTWHQFRAAGGEPLGFLCLVSTDRDRPQLPSEQELKALGKALGS
ncbi:cupin domain-containing protein [Usitatibacter palustris]|uniref:1-methylthio-D-xylulose 5-phosphate methylsulfurylase n=1 Tax=Usitatibacter palustris TaxID=2732487 RepID=A0A6M4H3M6_9PROT|nr:cupin domain-containing protein [Usitatibacter palustris]QJR14040.1 1-methylthio-D-xylulose 5-phosphate methylsulfurylase [Usitatibacter palustris]